MLPIVANGIAEEESLVTRHETNPKSAAFADLRGGRVAALFPLSDAFPDDDVLSRFVVAGCRDGTLGCVDAETLSVSPRIAAHERRREDETKTKGVACVCAGPKNTVASGGDDGIVRLWRAKKRRLSESEKTNDVLSTTGSNSGGDVANVTCVSLEPAGGTRERTGDDGDDVPSPNARGEEEGEKTEKKSAGTRCLCAVRDASGARVGVLAGDRAGGLTLYVAASSQ